METKQPTPIKTDLFRFVTIRTPQLISEEKKQWGFINHPDPSKSFFLKNVNTDNIDKARSAVREVVDSFKPIDSPADIKKTFPELYNFSSWLIKNRNTLTENEVNNKLKNVKKLNKDELILAWDNLFYQVLKRSNPTLRQVFIQLIIGSNFIELIKKPDIKAFSESFILTPKTPLPPDIKERFDLFLRRLAKAKVIIPKAFSEKRQTTETSNEENAGKSTAKSASTDNKNMKTTSKKTKDVDDQSAETDLEDGKLYGVNRLGIGVLRKVEQEVCCYVPGEVSRIENILAREYKERTTRSLISTEITEEDTTEIEVENQSDTVSTTRNELQTEIGNSLTQDSSINTGASLGVTAQGGFLGNGGSVTADGYFDFASSTSSTASDSEAQTYAQEVTNSALERVLQKTTQKRTSRILQEYEENNRHGFDNREGTQHVTGVYRWVDIIYTNRLINYGKRLMFEFLIPEPAKFYRQVVNKKGKNNNSTKSGSNSEQPKSPSEYGINSASDITEDNYLELGRTYDVTLADPITPEEKTITKSFGPTDDPDAKEKTYPFTMMFAEFGDLSKYSANQVEINFNFDYHLKTGGLNTEDGTYFILKVYNSTFSYDKNNLSDSDGTSKSTSRNKSDSKTLSLPDLKNELSPISVQIKNVYNFSVNLSVRMEVDASEKENWQDAVYDAIMQAYEDQLEEYENNLAEEEEASTEESSVVSNPDFNRTVEQREIQRIAIEMLTKPFGINMGNDFYYEGKKCKIPQVDQSKKWEKYAAKVKFFEQAFDWKMMAYLFYPYYWADKCDWRDLFQTEPADDPIFESFLQSGMARAVIPVRKGFEEAVDYYLETGDIWNGGGLVMDMDDDLYLSIEEELMEVEGFVDQEWQTRVPTTLTIVQGNSVYLEDESLPCCDDLEETGVDTLLRPSTVILGSTSSTS